MPTASAVVGDLIDVVVGRAALTSRALDLWAEHGPAPPDPRQPGPEPLLPPVHDRRPARACSPRSRRCSASTAISIASVIQHDPGDDAPEDSPVPLVIMTHLAVEADLTAALAEIDRLDVVQAPSVCLGVEE